MFYEVLIFDSLLVINRQNDTITSSIIVNDDK